MKRLFALALGVLPMSGFAQSQLAPDDVALLQAGLIVTADEFILPGYQKQHNAADELTKALVNYCEGSAPIAPAQTAFGDLFLTWQRTSAVQFGPIAEAEGPMRVQLWPDPKGFSRRAVLAAIRAEDPAVLVAGGLEGRSIALVNLTALELLIYQDLPPNTYGCDLSVAIARFQRDLALELVSAWTPGSAFRGDFDTAHLGNERYPHVDAVIRELLAGLVVYTDRIRRFKIERGLGMATGEARAERTEAVLSGLGLQSIAASHSTLHDLYKVSGGFFDVTADIGGLAEHSVLGDTAANVASALLSEDRSLVEIAEADGPFASELRQDGALMVYHEAYLKSGLTGSLGMTAGFTSADGD